MRTLTGLRTLYSPVHLAADELPSVLLSAGIRVVFGVQGGAALPIFDALYRDGRVSVVATAHEQGAAFAADGYARVTRNPGVCIATSGPGVLNTLTALGGAHMDSVPLVIVGAQVSRALIGTDGFQEADALSMSLPITKENWRVTDPSQLGSGIAHALQAAGDGRPRPVLVECPKDVTGTVLPGPVGSICTLSREPRRPEPLLVEKASSMLATAERPVILAGHGVILSAGQRELADLSRQLSAPVATTLLGLTSFDETVPLALGMIGMHGTAVANTILNECDLLLVLGARLDDRATGRLDAFAKNARLVHVDVDSSELGKLVQPTLAIHADARETLSALLRVVSLQNTHARLGWAAHVAALKREYSDAPFKAGPGELSAADVVRIVGESADSAAIVVAGVGQHQMLTALHYRFRTTNEWLTSGGLGAMGYALPAAIGAQFAAPRRQVVVIDGDGCFHMTSNELATAVRWRLPLKVFILNNGTMGMVRQWQDFFHDGRHAIVDNDHLPSFARLAEAYGARGLHAETLAELRDAVRQSFDHGVGPVVVDVRVSPTEDVYPMVCPGSANHDFILRRPET